MTPEQFLLQRASDPKMVRAAELALTFHGFPTGRPPTESEQQKCQIAQRGNPSTEVLACAMFVAFHLRGGITVLQAVATQDAVKVVSKRVWS